jgi:hypothetical protein
MLWVIVEGFRKAVGTTTGTALALAKLLASAWDPPSRISRSQTTDMTPLSTYFDVCWATQHKYTSQLLSIHFLGGVALSS